MASGRTEAAARLADRIEGFAGALDPTHDYPGELITKRLRNILTDEDEPVPEAAMIRCGSVNPDYLGVGTTPETWKASRQCIKPDGHPDGHRDMYGYLWDNEGGRAVYPRRCHSTYIPPGYSSHVQCGHSIGHTGPHYAPNGIGHTWGDDEPDDPRCPAVTHGDGPNVGTWRCRRPTHHRGNHWATSMQSPTGAYEWADDDNSLIPTTDRPADTYPPIPETEAPLHQGPPGDFPQDTAPPGYRAAGVITDIIAAQLAVTIPHVEIRPHHDSNTITVIGYDGTRYLIAVIPQPADPA